MKSLAAAALALLLTSPAQAAGLTALGAVKLLPPDAAARLCRIEAREGRPHPDRWHLLVHDPAQPSGLREFVVAGREIVASRTLSQFAEKLGPGDVIDLAKVSLDSDAAAERVQRFALANNVVVGSLNYHLRREGSGAAPLWEVQSLDASGQVLATVRLTATKGTLVAHDGFPIKPRAKDAKSPELTVYASSTLAPAPALADMTEPAPTPRRTVRRRKEPEKGGIHKVGNTLKKFFTGRR